VTEPSTAPNREGAPVGVETPGLVLVNWAPIHANLLAELRRTMAPLGLRRITCVEVGSGARRARDEDVVREGLDAEGEPRATSGASPGLDAGARGVAVRHVALASELSLDAWVAVFTNLVPALTADAIVVLPGTNTVEPDAISRLICVAIRRACAGARGPNVLVEVEDPEAAFEFAGLGVSTVFYAGHLRAALLGQACVDLGVYEFILGLLVGRHRIVSLPVPERLRQATFAEAAVELEVDERGSPITLVGITSRSSTDVARLTVQVNPGPRAALREVESLLALLDGREDEPELTEGAA
jgi:hypothetical protein